MKVQFYISLNYILQIYKNLILIFIIKLKNILNLLNFINQKMESQNQVMESKQQLTQKTIRRRRLLKKIIRNNRQVASDKQFQILLNLDKQLFAGYNAHRLGNFCIQQNRFQLAQQNLFRAKQLIGKKFLFTNVYLSLGNLQVKKKNFTKACQYYQKILQLSPHKNSKIYLNKDQVIFAGKLNSFNSYSDAHDHLIKIYIETNQLDKGYAICKAALQLKQQEQSAIMNFADAIQQLLEKRSQALSYAWKKLVQQTQAKKFQELQNFQPIQIKSMSKQQQSLNEQKQISIFCVKWGLKYSSEYVNKLYTSVKRNTSWKIKFYCFTDDSYGINKDILIKSLDDEWKKQWGKAVIFGQQIQGKKCYIDLDSIITGNLDEIFEYDGEFGTLKQQSKRQEKYKHFGYSTNFMIWKGNKFKCMYDKIKNNFQEVSGLLIKFDYWLDLVLKNAEDISLLYPKRIVNYKPDAYKSIPQGCCIVHFPKRPKPEEHPSQWVKKYWIT